MVTIPLPPGVEPAKPRASATLLVVRDDPGGLQALLLKRTERGDQNSGAWVFPGGLLDAADHAAHPYCHGLTDDSASARLGLAHGGLAFYVAALRECFEEAGLLLATGATALETLNGWRMRLQGGETSIGDFCEAHALQLATSQLHYISHWITPLEMPKRFDTRFFVAAAPSGQTVRHDGTEMQEHLWVRPSDVLKEEPVVRVLGPALHILRQLSRHDNVTSVLQWASTLDSIPTIMPRLVKDENSRIRLVLPPGIHRSVPAPFELYDLNCT